MTGLWLVQHYLIIEYCKAKKIHVCYTYKVQVLCKNNDEDFGAAIQKQEVYEYFVQKVLAY
mgnify:CR=1 FL=1